MGLHDYTFYDLISRNAVCFNRKPAWFEVDDDRTVTFAECKEKVDRLANGLQNAGIKKGDLEKKIKGLECLPVRACRSKFKA